MAACNVKCPRVWEKQKRPCLKPLVMKVDGTNWITSGADFLSPRCNLIGYLPLHLEYAQSSDEVRVSVTLES